MNLAPEEKSRFQMISLAEKKKIQKQNTGRKQMVKSATFSNLIGQ